MNVRFPRSRPITPSAALLVALAVVVQLTGCASNPPVDRRDSESAVPSVEQPGSNEIPSVESSPVGASASRAEASAADGVAVAADDGASQEIPQEVVPDVGEISTLEGASLTPSSSAVLQRFSDQLAEQNCSRSTTARRIEVIERQKRSIERKFNRVLPLFDYVLAEVERADLPSQFALIPWAESGFKADPGNRGAVQGLWQFTASTGKAHGLRIDNHFDGRRAAIESTAAAVDHLKVLMEKFGDWRLALLAYNAGPNRVARGLRGLPEKGDRLPNGLAPHSIAYLNRIAAMSCVLADPDSFSTAFAQQTFEPLVVIRRPAFGHSAAQLANAAGIDLPELLDYNAGFLRGDVADDAPLELLLPVSAAHRMGLAAAAPYSTERSSRAPPRTGTTYVVSEGDTLWQIARRYGIALSDLLRWNKIGRTKVIRPGDVLRTAPNAPPES